MTTAGPSSRTSRDRGAVATEFGLLVTLVSVLVTGSIAALLGQVWHFDPCEIFQVCSSDAESQQSGDGGTTPVDPSTVPPPAPTSVPTSVAPTSVPSSAAPTSSESVSPTACVTSPAVLGEPAATAEPAPTECAAPSGSSVP